MIFKRKLQTSRKIIYYTYIHINISRKVLKNVLSEKVVLARMLFEKKQKRSSSIHNAIFRTHVKDKEVVVASSFNTAIYMENNAGD